MTFRYLSFFVFAISLFGCTAEKPRGSVSGTVTWQDKPVNVGYIIFMSPDKQFIASSDLDAEGQFQLSTSLPQGEYDVGIAPPSSPSDDSGASPPKSPVPLKYSSPEGSGLTFTVQAGPNVADFHLK